jgi:hypothetical protein
MNTSKSSECTPTIAFDKSNQAKIVVTYKWPTQVPYKKWLKCVDLDLNKMNTQLMSLYVDLIINKSDQSSWVASDVKNIIEQSSTLKQVFTTAITNKFTSPFPIEIVFDNPPRSASSWHMKLFKKWLNIFTFRTALQPEESVLLTIGIIEHVNFPNLFENNKIYNFIEQSLLQNAGMKKQHKSVTKKDKQ